MNANTHILIVDDRHSEVWFIERVLQKMGLNVTTAFDGEDGLSKIAEAIPSLIILDTIMPKMDGYSFFHRLSTRQEVAKVPVLLLTDKGEDHEKSKLYPFTRKLVTGIRNRTPEYPRGKVVFLSKPIRPEDLEEKVRHLLQSGNERKHSNTSSARKPRVLIIDDDVVLTAKIAHSLQKTGVETITAAGGLVGLSRVKEELPDLVVLDTIMPELNGLQILQYIKHHYQIPVIMIPGREEADLLNKALLCGADSYLIKPFEPDALVSFIQKKLGKINKLPVSAQLDLSKDDYP